ncbi:MAG: hypothetical protein JXA30_21375 [Deltaproteobacteria bacterium]|nr:hypothetical protein [Deltaproteobacteria bacterium]
MNFGLGKDSERLETHREGQDPRSESQLQSHFERSIQRGGDNGYRQATETDIRRLRSDVGARQQATDSEVDHRAQNRGDGIGDVEKPIHCTNSGTNSFHQFIPIHVQILWLQFSSNSPAPIHRLF